MRISTSVHKHASTSLFVGIAFSFTFASAAPLPTANLILNGGAELGAASQNGDTLVSVPDWATSGNFTVVAYGAVDSIGAFPTLSGPGPVDRGSSFFSGGPNNSSSDAKQIIDLSAYAQLIDSSAVNFTVSGYFGGYLDQDDNATLMVNFLSGADATVGNSSVGGVSATDRNDDTGLLFRATTGQVPVGTRAIELTLQMTQETPDYNDGYADNLSLVLTQVPEPSVFAVAGTALACQICRFVRRGGSRRGHSVEERLQAERRYRLQRRSKNSQH